MTIYHHIIHNLCKAMLCVRRSVRPSVRMCVRPSIRHSGSISQLFAELFLNVTYAFIRVILRSQSSVVNGHAPLLFGILAKYVLLGAMVQNIGFRMISPECIFISDLIMDMLRCLFYFRRNCLLSVMVQHSRYCMISPKALHGWPQNEARFCIMVVFRTDLINMDMLR